MTEKTYYYRGHKIERVVFHYSNGREYRYYEIHPINPEDLRNPETGEVYKMYRHEFSTLAEAKLMLRLIA